ncbi:MAG: zinc ribbon domain-containing protein [Candidatus Eisenbacteria bacterium]|uniref:Zinc ribbon domain-containing protein n=1 Tax=Eiseniibacteriota bacterium TaxID=2212470 RepID=A0A538SQC1_UNCEI|nr:MAG: zinc ribbon domain-containing protein [Candidatus Eisenbacteria bacterium]
MPIFEYRCAACGERFEVLLSHAGEPPGRCRRCGGTDVARQLSVFAVTKPAGDSPGPCGSADCACRRSQQLESGHR